jgi:hypothetical protein
LTEIDFLMLILWGVTAVFCLTIQMPVLVKAVLLSAVAIGALSIVKHFYTVLHGGRNEGDLAMAAVLPVGCVGFGAVEVIVWNLITRITPRTYDALLERWDFGIAEAVRAFAETHWWLYKPLSVVYNPCLWVAAMLAIVLSRSRYRRRMLWSLFLGGVLVIPCFILLPAVGPVHVGDPNAARNCMPSMHFAWSMLLAINSRGWAKWMFGVFAALTAVATMSTGEHYFPDLLAAIPWTWFLMYLTRKLVG